MTSMESQCASLAAFLVSSVERNHIACLSASTAWSSELLYYCNESEQASPSHASPKMSCHMEPSLALVRSYYDMKEYRRAAELLAPHSNVLTAGRDRFVHSTPLKLYFYVYYSMIASEKQLTESSSTDASAEHYSAEYHRLLSILNAAPALASDAYLTYLKALLYCKLKEIDQCHSCCLESIRLYAGNWSAWKLLSSTLYTEEQLSLTLARLQETSTDLYFLPFFKAIMYMQFHLYSATAAILTSDILPHYSQKLPFYGYTLGEVYYSLKDFVASEKIFREYMTDHPHALTGLDVYSNLLYVQEDEPTLASLAEHASKIDVYSVITNVILGNLTSLKGEHDKSLIYFRRCTSLDPSYLPAWTLLGHEYIENRLSDLALASYASAIDKNPREYRAIFGMGQAYELLGEPRRALVYYLKAATIKKKDPRIWTAIGGSYESLHESAHAMHAYSRAVSYAESSPNNLLLEAECAILSLAKICIANEQALQAVALYEKWIHRCYPLYAPLPLSPQTAFSSPDARPCADINAQVDFPSLLIEPLLFLASYYKDKRENTERAAHYCHLLLNVPGPEKEEAKNILSELDSTSSTK